jgi:hypothetical protein
MMQLFATPRFPCKMIFYTPVQISSEPVVVSFHISENVTIKTLQIITLPLVYKDD